MLETVCDEMMFLFGDCIFFFIHLKENTINNMQISTAISAIYITVNKRNRMALIVIMLISAVIVYIYNNLCNSKEILRGHTHSLTSTANNNMHVCKRFKSTSIVPSNKIVMVKLLLNKTKICPIHGNSLWKC